MKKTKTMDKSVDSVSMKKKEKEFWDALNNFGKPIPLKKRFEEVVNDYIRQFEKKHGCEVEFWVGDRIAEIALVSDCYLGFSDIRFDLDNRINKKLIWEWYYKNVNALLEGDKFPNYENWLKLNKKVKK